MMLYTPQDRIVSLGARMQVCAPIGTSGPPQINLWAWYDFSDATTLYTDSGVTLVSADGDAIGQVNDKSGNARHLVQTTTSSKPTYKTNVQNGLSVGRFDGGDYYEKTGLTLGSSYSIYMVMNKTDASGRWGLDLCANGPAFIGGYLAGNIEFYGGPSPRVTIGTFSGSTRALYAITYDGTTATPYKNGSAGTGGTGTAKTINRIMLGGPSNYWVGDICEVLIYSESNATATRQAAEAHINGKWALW